MARNRRYPRRRRFRRGRYQRNARGRAIRRRIQRYNRKVGRYIGARSFGRQIGFPERLRCRLKYTDWVQFIGAGPEWQIYRGNSIYDPDYTGVGSQPLFYDQLITVYNRYRIFGCKLVVTLTNNLESDFQELIVYPSSIVNLPATWEAAKQQPGSTWRATDPLRKQVVKRFHRTGKYQETWDDTNDAVISANPNNVWYWLIGVNNLAGDDGCFIHVSLTYYAEMYDRNTMAES